MKRPITDRFFYYSKQQFYSMKRVVLLFIAIFLRSSVVSALNRENPLKLFKADNSRIQYVGRINFSNPRAPRIWSPGVYIKAKFAGNRCEILINDEVSGNNHNYLEIIIDDNKPYRIKLHE